ncbi:MAG: hypothetical protein LAT76_11575 [Schleiferiaceae bacterium]|nr:hypothetical protein [Schleiferiaceae bacterium]
MKVYPENLTESIEYTIVKEHVAAYAVTPKARQELLDLVPVADFEIIKDELALVNEMLAIYESGRSVPALASADISKPLSLLRIANAMLTAEQFMDLRDLTERYNYLYRFFQNNEELVPLCAALIKGFPPNTEIIDAIDRVFEKNGQVKSNASPALAKIRTQLGKRRAAADRIFYRSMQKYNEQGILGDFRETVHDTRRVLAINAAHKGRVNGIFHGSSSKNSLYFVEPAETIEINNEIAYLVDEERKEIKRILTALTTFVSTYREVLLIFSKSMARLDFLHAKGRYAFAEGAVMPELVNHPHLKLVQAINPVLRYFNKQKGRNVIPLDLELSAATRMIVISGPNAGGKSLTLKTAGLMSMMIQSGLLIPVHPKSKIGVFQHIFGDIGDSQSIENELSTYSSKLEKMKVFLQWADSDTLLLIDEFGSGSDPDLGGAIAQVFLKKLNQYKAFGVVTTHYNGIKALASSLAGVANGSMRFNKETFEPEYVLQSGMPGSSYTFEVATRAGIPKKLVAEAKTILSDQTIKLDSLLVFIQDEKNKLVADRQKMTTRLQELEVIKAKHEKQISRLEEKVSKQANLNEESSEHLRWGKRFEQLVNGYVKIPTAKNKKAVVSRFVKFLNESAGQKLAESETKQKHMSKKKAAHLHEILSEEIKVGDSVKLINSRQPGEVTEIKGEKYTISFGMMKTTVGREKIILANRSV